MPVAESMSLGLPVIASDSGSLPEIGGEACHYVKANQPLEMAGAMLRISTDAGYRAWLSTAGREQAKKFSHVEAAMQLAEQLLKASAERGDLRVRLRRTKNAGYGRLLLVKNILKKGLRRLKSALSGT